MPLDSANHKRRPGPGDAGEEQPASLRGPLRPLLGWVSTHRLLAAVLLTACALLAVVLAATCLWAVAGQRSAPEITAAMVLEALDQDDYAAARRLAEAVRREPSPSPEALAAAAFAQGMAAAADAEATQAAGSRQPDQLACQYLEEARDRGFPAGRERAGLVALGRSLYRSGQVSASRSVMSDALNLGGEGQAEIEMFLAEACLQDSPPDLAAATAYNARFLARRELSAAMRSEGLLQRAEILHAAGKTADAAAALRQLPRETAWSARALLLSGQVLIDEARQAKKAARGTSGGLHPPKEKYQAAIEVLESAQERDTLEEHVAGKAQYLAGICCLEMGDDPSALAAMDRVAKTHPGSPEALAAELNAAEISRRLGRDAAALAAYRQVLRSITDPASYRNPWVDLDDLRRRLLEAYQHYLDQQKYALCLRLAASLSPAFPPERGAELIAETHRAWGAHWLQLAAGEPPSKAAPLEAEGRKHWRLAGQAYERLAQLRVTTRQYPDDLWAAGQSYLDGHSYTRAAAVLKEYLKIESRRRQALAMARLGEALLALGRYDEAIATLQQCVEFHPRDAAAFQARLLASQALGEKGECRRAEAMLRDNMAGDITPSSPEWRDSLFALGRLLHAAGRYDGAIPCLEEAVARYPDDPQALESRYLMVDCCRRLARQATEQAGQDPVAIARAAAVKQAQEHLHVALARAREVEQTLSRRQAEAELAPHEKKMLRNCSLGVADVLFELGQYDAAAKAYGTAANRYQGSPEVLEAYVQMSRSYRLMHRPADARLALEQAKVILKRMKPDLEFARTTNFTRQEWSDRLESLGKDLGVGT